MNSLYPVEKHSPLRAEAWDEGRAAEAIRTIAADAEDSFHPDYLWPVHPLDGDGPPSTNYYFGAGGVFWALSYLFREGATDALPSWLRAHLPSIIERNRIERKFYPTPDTASYLFGDVPLLMLQWLHEQAGETLEAIYGKIEANTEQPVLELMWGMPGSMIAALRMNELSPETRWAEVYKRQARKVVDAWIETGEHGYQWSPVLYGQEHRGLGAVHGFAGNVTALLAGLEHLDAEMQALILDRVAESLLKTVVRNENHANWPRQPSQPQDPWRVYHCHGAAGVVTSLSGYPCDRSPDLDAVMLEAGELIWSAGPLRKGSTLCHGTAGNGFAFLKLFARTGDELWLERARAFAMHSIWQCTQARELFGQGRYSLWTGDPGVAIYLHECIRASARFPTLDVF